MTRPRGVLVLGMHRSGTSAVAGMLSRLGLNACRADDAVRGPWNPTGHFESQSLMALDDRLLGDMGCTWWSPPPSGEDYAAHEATLTVPARQARQVLRRAYPSAPWVWKDPRACLLLPYWRRVLRDQIVGVVVVRNPLDVAASLERRNATTTGFGVALWERYNRLLLEHASAMPILVTRFDDLVDDPDRWTRAMTAGLQQAGLSLARPSLDADPRPVDAELRHSVHTRDDLVRLFPWAVSLYDALESVVGTWERFEPPTLDAEPAEVRQELAALSPDTPPAWRPPPWALEQHSS